MQSDKSAASSNDGLESLPSNPFNFQTRVISDSPVSKHVRNVPTPISPARNGSSSSNSNSNSSSLRSLWLTRYAVPPSLPDAAQNVGQRRGHKYKHSSISTQHQIFQEPPPRPPPVLPASLPIPTPREAWRSLHADQRWRVYWCLCHVAVAMFVFFQSEGSLALMALSHLIFFDAGSAAVCVAVDVLGNFEAWRRSSIRHPFGFERAEVLTGFAMSIFLLFGGFDLVSHGLKHVIEASGSGPIAASPGVNWAPLSAVFSTAISAYGLKNHGRIARIMRVGYLSALPRIFSNPFHFLTLSFSLLLIALPLLSITLHIWLDRLVCAGVAVFMCLFGIRLAVAQASMLLMSYSGRSDGVLQVVREIELDPVVTSIEKAQFWHVHYGIGMANLGVLVSKGLDTSAQGQLRGRIVSLVQTRLGEGYGYGWSLRWEVTVQLAVDTGFLT